MLYDTHKRYGQVAGLMMLPVAANLGVTEVNGDNGYYFSGDSMLMNILTMGMYIFVALKASMFGAEFPDIDSPESKPASKHKILAFLFKMFGVKHRGKFSHDFLTQTLLWGFVYMAVAFVGKGLFQNELGGFIVSLAKVYVFFTYVGVLSHLVADAMTTEGVWFAWKFKVKFMPVWIRKISIFGWRPFKTWFTTASVWNDMNYRFMTVMIPFASLYAFFNLIKMI